MKHYFKFFTLLFVITLFLFGCSDDDSTDPQISDEKWEMGMWQSGANIQADSLIVKLTIKKNESVVSGSGEIHFGLNGLARTISGTVSGAYSDSNININVTDAVTSNSYVFIGSLNNDAYQGTSTLTIDGTQYIVADGSLFKSDD